jgi:hypothetical protein
MKSITITSLLLLFSTSSFAQQFTYRNVSYPCPMLTCESPISPESVVQEASRLVIQTAAAYRPIINNFTQTTCYQHPNSTASLQDGVIRSFKCPRGSICGVNLKQQAWLNMDYQVNGANSTTTNVSPILSNRILEKTCEDVSYFE